MSAGDRIYAALTRDKSVDEAGELLRKYRDNEIEDASAVLQDLMWEYEDKVGDL